jgi:hypothetical protein
MPYAPVKDSAAYKACRYFRDHPTARLNARDLTGKLGLDLNAVVPLLATAIRNQSLERSQVNGVWHYRAGPKIGDVIFDGPAPAQPVMRATSEARAPAPAAAVQAPATKPVDTLANGAAHGVTPAAAPAASVAARTLHGYRIEPVPVVPVSGAYSGVQRREVFAAMDVDHSVVLPRIEARNFLQAANKWGRKHGRKFSQQRLDADLTRIGRVE